MPDLASPHHGVHTHARAGLEGHARTLDRRGHLPNFAHQDLSALFALFANGHRRRQRRPAFAATLHFRLSLRRLDRGRRENVHRDKSGLQERFDGLHLLLILIRRRNGRIRCGKAMVVDHPFPVARILRRHERHVAIGAGLRFLRIVEAACTVTRNPRRLPVVVVVEPAQPAVIVHRLVEMHLVAGRAELGSILPHERLQKRLLVRTRLQERQEIIHLPDHRILARREIVQRRILNRESAIAHRTIDVHDGVARHASQPILRLGSIDLIFDRLLPAPVEEHRVIVTARAPLTVLRRAADLLHVLNGLPVKLIVERCEMVHRAVPLLVNILVAFAAALRIHEEVGRDRAAHIRPRRRRPERRLRAAAFLLHRGRHEQHVVADPILRIRE